MSADRRAFRRIVAFFPLLLLLFGCSESPKNATISEAKGERRRASEPVSAQSAFRAMFVSARSWAVDVMPLRIAQIDVDEVKADGGKAGAWETLFVSPGQRRVRRYIFSVVHRPVRNLRSGVNADPPDAWSGASGSEPFLIQAFKTDSTAAYETAMKKGREYARKHPELPVKLLLEKTRRFPDPAWRVYWGESVSSSGYSIFVDATTGDYLATGR